MRSLEEAEVYQKRVLLRADLDIDLDDQGQLVSDLRITSLLPSLKFLTSHKAKTIVLAHWGRPEGQVVESLRLDPQVGELQRHFSQIKKANDCLGEGVGALVSSLRGGDVLVLENLRFHQGEEGNDPQFASSLAQWGDLYVNDAFAVCHRSHASVVGLPSLLPAYAGLHLTEEVANLSRVLTNPARPLVVVVSGVKAETKVPVVARLAQVADWILLAGKIHLDPQCPRGKNIIVPQDGEVGLDIGEKTIALFKDYLGQAKTILWNGALGRYEDGEHERGTREIATAIASSSAYTIAGGGSTLGALSHYNLLSKIDFVSTGGGSMLEFLSGKTLPGIAALTS